MKIKFESKEGISIFRIIGKIDEKGADKLFESFEKIFRAPREVSVIINLDQVSEILGAGFVMFYHLVELVKKIIFCCSASNAQLQKILRLVDFNETYQLFQTESEALVELQK